MQHVHCAWWKLFFSPIGIGSAVVLPELVAFFFFLAKQSAKISLCLVEVD